MSNTSNNYSSVWAAILTMTGVAVGLGNVWRFPYMMGSYGGSAFLMLYLVFTLLLAFPALLTEMSLGQSSRNGTVGAFEFIFGKQIGTYLGYLLVIAVTIAGSYYAVVVAQVFFSAIFSTLEGFSVGNKEEYHILLDNDYIQYVCSLFLIVSALFVSHKGLRAGIERISKVIMPFFIASMVYMIINAWMIPGTLKEVRHFLSPDFSAIGFTEVFAALGQSFFSIGLGGTFVVVYSSYIRDKKQIPQISLFTCLGDLGSSLLVSLFLIPVILVFQLKMDSGPSLLFETLPELFTQLPGGRWIGPLFLTALSLVAFLSLIAAFQVPLSSLQHKGFSRKKLIISFALLQLLLIIPSVIYPSFIGFLDLIFGSGMQVFGSFLAIVGVWWGVKKIHFRDILFSNFKPAVKLLSIFWLKWLVPGCLIAILVGYIYNIFAS